MRLVWAMCLLVGVARGQTLGSGSGVGAVAGGVMSAGVVTAKYLPEPVRGAPYSMVTRVTTHVTEADGKTATPPVGEMRRMRDDEGRTRSETGMLRDGVLQVTLATLTDPVERTRTVLYVTSKKAVVTRYPERAPLTEAEREEAAAARRARTRAFLKNHRSEPEEVLEPRTIDGVYAEGRRRTTVIPAPPPGLPAGQADADGTQRTVSDSWMSKELKIEIASRWATRRGGQMIETIMEATEIHRGEPEASLFQVPPGYEVTEQPWDAPPVAMHAQP